MNKSVLSGKCLNLDQRTTYKQYKWFKGLYFSFPWRDLKKFHRFAFFSWSKLIKTSYPEVNKARFFVSYFRFLLWKFKSTLLGALYVFIIKKIKIKTNNCLFFTKIFCSKVSTRYTDFDFKLSMSNLKWHNTLVSGRMFWLPFKPVNALNTKKNFLESQPLNTLRKAKIDIFFK